MENKELLRLNELKKAKAGENLLGWVMVSPYVLVFLVFNLLPVVVGFVFSFMKYNPYIAENNTFVGLKNYINIFDPNNAVSAEFWGSFAPMLLYCLVIVPCLLAIPLVLAYFINMNPPGYKLFRAIIYLPTVLSVTVIGIIFSCMFQGDEYGLINALFGTSIKWLSGKPFDGDILRWVVIVIVSIWWLTGTNFIILASALRNIPKSLYEACEMDGGNRWQLIRKVTLPNIKSSLNLCLFTTLIGQLNLFGQPYVLYDSGNVNELVSPMMFIRYYLSGITYASQTGYLCAVAIVFGLFVMVFSIIQQKATGDRKRKMKRDKEYHLYSRNQKYLQEYRMGLSAEKMEVNS